MSSSAARYFPGVFGRRNGNGAHERISDTSFDRSESCNEDAGVTKAEISDEALLFRLQEKDISALGLLYRRYARVVYSVCVRILKDPIEAEDLVHEVFLSLYRRCGSFDAKKGAARSWVLQLTYHKCFDWRDYLKARHGYGQGIGEEDVPAARPQTTQDSDPTDLIIWTPRMKAAFRTLSKEQQLTLKLYYFKGCTFQEVADELGYSYGNAKNHFYRGMERLRRILFNGGTQGSSHGAGQKTQCEAKEMRR